VEQPGNGKPDLSDAGEGASGADEMRAGRPLFRHHGCDGKAPLDERKRKNLRKAAAGGEEGLIDAPVIQKVESCHE